MADWSFDLPPPAPALLARGGWTAPSAQTVEATEKKSRHRRRSRSSSTGSSSHEGKRRRRRHDSSGDSSSDTSDSHHRRKKKKKRKKHRSRSRSLERKPDGSKRERMCSTCGMGLMMTDRKLWFCPRCPARHNPLAQVPTAAPQSTAASLPVLPPEYYSYSIDDRTVFMGNCPDHLTPERVQQLLEGVEKVDLFKENMSRMKNMGFVTFRTRAGAEAAIAQQFLNVDGYMVRLKRYEKGNAAEHKPAAEAVACCFNCGGDHHLSNCPLPLSCTYCLKGGHTFHVCPRRLTAQRGMQMGISQATGVNLPP